MFIDFREKGRGTRSEEERERGTEIDIDHLPPLCVLTGDQTCNLGMCPDPELNLQPLGVWGDAPTI